MKKILLLLLLATTTLLAHHPDKIYCEGEKKVIDIETGHTGSSTGYVYYTVLDENGKVIQPEKREKTGSNGHAIIKITVPPEYKKYTVKFRCSKNDWNYTLKIEETDVCTVTLPIDVFDLKIVNENNILTLKWQTANEKNFSHFEIQQTENLFEISTIGNMVVNSFDIPFDISNNNKTNYYRLKAIDFDGSFNYTKWFGYDSNQKNNLIFISSHGIGDLYKKNNIRTLIYK